MKKIKFISTEDYFNVVRKVFNRELHRAAPEGAKLKLFGLNPELCQQPGRGVPNVLLSEHIGKEITKETSYVMLLIRPVYWNKSGEGPENKQYIFEAFPGDKRECDKPFQKLVAISGHSKACRLSSRKYKIFVDAQWSFTKTFQTGGLSHFRPLHIIIAETGNITITGKNHTGRGNDFEDYSELPIERSGIFISSKSGILQLV